MQQAPALIRVKVGGRIYLSMARVKEKYNRKKAEQRFEHVYETVAGDKCIYCGMPSDGEYDHQWQLPCSPAIWETALC